MAGPHLKGTLETLTITKEYKSGKSFDAVINGQALKGFGPIAEGITEGSEVVVWKNGEGRDTKYNIQLDTPQGATPSSSVSTNARTTTAPAQASFSGTQKTGDARQNSIVAQNALNRGVDIMNIVTLATIAAIDNDVAGVKKASLKNLSNPDFVVEMAKHYGSLVFDSLVAGDLTQELPKFETPTENTDD